MCQTETSCVSGGSDEVLRQCFYFDIQVKHARDTSSVKSSESMESLPQSGAADQTQASQQPVANTGILRFLLVLP